MGDEFKNKIKRLELENFTCFSKVELDFSSGINVFIGENGTGKTHLLKVLYAHLQANFELEATYYSKGDSIIPDNNHYLLPLTKKLLEIFQPSSGKELIKNYSDTATMALFVGQAEGGEIYRSRIKEQTITLKPKSTSIQKLDIKQLFIPTHEMLSWQRGFINLYNRQETGFDETYYDLAVSLNAEPLRGKFLAEAEELVKELEEAINAKIFKKDNRFYFQFNESSETHEASVVAQGINKLGQLIYLILNGSIDKNTIIFWDEPETGLNPKYINVVAKFLQTLANAGCQIFVATHDYLLIHQLSLGAEYREVKEAGGEKIPDMKFFSLYKGEDGTVVESGATLADIQHNPILDEYAALYDLESFLFRKSANLTAP